MPVGGPARALIESSEKFWRLREKMLRVGRESVPSLLKAPRRSCSV